MREHKAWTGNISTTYFVDTYYLGTHMEVSHTQVFAFHALRDERS